jgi:Tol biopolymer transport system component
VTNILTKESRVNLTLGVVKNPRRPRWSPDGERLAFVASDSAPGASDDEIYIIERATLALRQVTDNDATDTDPAWSEDGTSLLIASNRTHRALGGPPSATALRTLWQLPLDAPEQAVELSPGSPGDNAQPDWFWGTACGAR